MNHGSAPRKRLSQRFKAAVAELAPRIEDRGIAAWSVIVVSEEPREIDDAINASAVGAPGILQRPGSSWFHVMGRLDGNVPLARAQAVQNSARFSRSFDPRKSSGVRCSSTIRCG